MKSSFKQNFYSNFHYALILNKNIPLTEMRKINQYTREVINNEVLQQNNKQNKKNDPDENKSSPNQEIENDGSNDSTIKPKQTTRNYNIDDLKEFFSSHKKEWNSEKYNTRFNILKHILFYKKFEDNNKDEIKLINSIYEDVNDDDNVQEKVGAKKFLDTFREILNKDVNEFKRKFKLYLKFICEEYMHFDVYERCALITADCNIFISRSLSVEMEPIFKNIINTYTVIDINYLYHIRRGNKPDVALVGYIAEKGYYTLLKIIKDSGKEIDAEAKDETGKTKTLISWCGKGSNYEKCSEKYTDLPTNHQKSIEMIWNMCKKRLHLSKNKDLRIKFFRDFVDFNLDENALEMLNTYNISTDFLEVLNTRILGKFLNTCVKEKKRW